MKIKILCTTLLLGTLSALHANTPIIMSYYENWDQYQNYPMPGNAQMASNPDLSAKLTGINTLAYAFLEIITPQDANLAQISTEDQKKYIGTVRFSDAWSDLNSNNANDTKFCNAYSYSCGAYVYSASKYIPWPSSSTGAIGNFQAFVNADVANHSISIGGAGHDDAWIAAINNPNNFVSSVSTLVNIYGVNGIDLDFEPDSDTLQKNAAGFVNLIQQLHQALPKVMLTWPIIPNQNFINALSTGQWQTVAHNISYISIMGYDMAGEFSQPQVIGLHSALLAPNPGDFNDDSAVKALNAVGISNSQIILGVPFYGRAVAGVPSAGLGQAFTSTVQGDLDIQGCNITPHLTDSCGGMFSYTHLLASAYKPTEVNIGFTDIGAYTYDASKQLFVSYDSPTSMTAKANYVITNQLAGVMAWALRFDTTMENPNSLLMALDKSFGITPKPPTTSGQVIVTNNNTAGLGMNHTLNIILQEGNGPLYQQPTISVGSILATPGQNAILEYPAAFGAYNGPLTIWAQDISASGSSMIQCKNPSVNYSPTGKQISIYVVANGNNIDCASWYN